MKMKKTLTLPNKIIKFDLSTIQSLMDMYNHPDITFAQASILNVDLNKKELIREISTLSSTSTLSNNSTLLPLGGKGELVIIKNNIVYNQNRREKTLYNENYNLICKNHIFPAGIKIRKIKYSDFLNNNKILTPPYGHVGKLFSTNQYFFFENISNFTLKKDFLKIYNIYLFFKYNNNNYSSFLNYPL